MANRTKKRSEIIKNEKKLKKCKKFSKRVFTNDDLCGKLWEKFSVGKRVKLIEVLLKRKIFCQDAHSSKEISRENEKYTVCNNVAKELKR